MPLTGLRCGVAAIVLFVASAAAAQSTPQGQPKKPPKQPDPVFQWDDHPTIRAGALRIAFRARVQTEVRRSDVPVPDEDERTIDVARKRVGVEGEVRNLLDFQVEYELGDSADPWRDVFVNYRQFDAAQVQVGKFKLPFSVDENTSATNNDFVYRSLAANHLAPGRDRGVMAHGRVLNRIVRYEIGSFEHDGRNARPKRAERVVGDRTLVGRVTAQPFRSSNSPAADFQVGAAWASTDVPEGFSGIRGETALGARFFNSDFWVKGKRQRVGFELRWRPGPFSVKSEFIRATDERVGQSVEDTDLSVLRATGWYVSGTWAITGEAKADGLDNPKRPIFRGGIGAVEVAARLERLTFDSGASGEPPSTSPRADVILGNSNRAATLGVSWYLNRWVKLQFNMIRETLTDPSQGPLPSQPSFWSRVVRFQFTL